MNLANRSRALIGAGEPSLVLALGLVALMGACGPSASTGPARAQTPAPATGASSAEAAIPGAAPGSAFALVVVEDRGGQLRISAGQVGRLARLSPRELRAVNAAWRAGQVAARPGTYCGRLVDPQGRPAARRCLTPRVTAHLAPRNSGSAAVDAPLSTIAFALRLPWPATATGGGWQLVVEAPDGRNANWRPRE